MGIKNLHDEPFDESTLCKLGIFGDYAEAWIPTFVMGGFPVICIFDFFAGPGYDKVGVAGSPIRLLEKIKKHIGNIWQKQVKVVVHFNEIDKEKNRFLRLACQEYLRANDDVQRAIDLHIYQEDCDFLFPKLVSSIRNNPSLVFLDQNGIKFLSPTYLQQLEAMRQTDFLCFMSASYLWRFGETEEFKKHLELDISDLKKKSYKAVHRSIVKHLRMKLKVDTELSLYPFSLQKGSNIYGLIFGASHPLAVEKFLDIAWTVNNINGEADFDIDNEAEKRQRKLFESNLTKIEMFENSLREKVLAGEIHDNLKAYDFAQSEGHPGKHASKVLIDMKKERRITFEGRSPLINYQQIYKNKRIVVFEILGK